MPADAGITPRVFSVVSGPARLHSALSMAAMRAFHLTCLLGLLSMASCAKRGEPVVQGGELSNAEKQGIARIHPGLVEWKPDFNATWNRDGLVRRIYFHRYEITSIGWPYQVFVFGGDGSVVEANVLDGPNDCSPRRVLSVSPLRVEFAGAFGSRTVEGFRYSAEEGRRTLQGEAEFEAEVRGVIEKWKASGDTNVANLHDMLNGLHPGTTNRPK